MNGKGQMNFEDNLKKLEQLVVHVPDDDAGRVDGGVAVQSLQRLGVFPNKSIQHLFYQINMHLLV